MTTEFFNSLSQERTLATPSNLVRFDSESGNRFTIGGAFHSIGSVNIETIIDWFMQQPLPIKSTLDPSQI